MHKNWFHCGIMLGNAQNKTKIIQTVCKVPNMKEKLSKLGILSNAAYIFCSR